MKTTKLLTVMILALCIVLALSACDLNITGDINGTLNDSTSTKDPENAPVQDPTEDDKTKDEPTKDNQTKDEPVYDDELCEDGKEHIDVNEDNFCDKCGKRHLHTHSLSIRILIITHQIRACQNTSTAIMTATPSVIDAAWILTIMKDRADPIR